MTTAIAAREEPRLVRPQAAAIEIENLALLFSVIFNDVLRPAVLAIIATVLLNVPGYFPQWRGWSPLSYWASLPAYLGNGFPTKEFVVCLAAAVLPLAGALVLFRGKAY